jgi:hypothetical protein
MDPLQSRILPRLVLDTISSLWVAHDSLHDEWKSQAKKTITALHKADLTDADEAALFLLGLADHLRKIESRLKALDRPFAARKVSHVLSRVAHLTASEASHCGQETAHEPRLASQQPRGEAAY